MRNILLAICFAVPLAVVAQNRDTPQKSAPNTKIEAAVLKQGTLLLKGFTELGKVKGEGGLISAKAYEVREAKAARTAQYGVSIEVWNVQRDSKRTSYIDEDEIDALLQGIDYVSKIDGSITTFNRFEGVFNTKDDFSVATFSDESKNVLAGVSSGWVNPAIVVIAIGDLAKIRDMLQQAKTLFANAKAARK